MKKQQFTIVEKLIAGLSLGFAFIVMASIITPSDTAAENVEHGNHRNSGHFSTDPHMGLTSLGSIENGDYLMKIFSTDLGPRYSIYNRRTNELLATLITSEKVQERFPDLPLQTMDFTTPEILQFTGPHANF